MIGVTLSVGVECIVCKIEVFGERSRRSEIYDWQRGSEI